MEKEDPGLSLVEVAQITGLSLRTLRRHIKEGKLSFHYVTGKKGREIRVKRENLPVTPKGRMATSDTGDTIRRKMSPLNKRLQEELNGLQWRFAVLQGRYEEVTKALTEGQEVTTRREETLKALAVEVERLKNEKEALAREKETLALDMAKLRRPWWKKLFWTE